MIDAGPYLLAELVEEYDEPIRVDVPRACRFEARLPGALQAWSEGIERERQELLLELWRPRWTPVTSRFIGFVLSRVQGEADSYRALYVVSDVYGRRLGLLARAELASRFARQMRALLRRAQCPRLEPDRAE
ncbi:MAG: hypothetical protein SangKO_011680 [Sandaracinaceae bacterium]